MTRAQDVAKTLTNEAVLMKKDLLLDLGDYRISLKSNSTQLLSKLEVYFSHVLGAGTPDIEVLAIDQQADDFGFCFTDWAREPGKKGRKDAYHDLSDGRMVQKVRTGMVFLQSIAHRVAVGPCLENDNQVINFINAQYMNWLQQNGALICHASGLSQNGNCLGMAGFSGGGKSTLMLRLLEQSGFGYVTNDRLFLKQFGKEIEALGIPKLPRINPGTIVTSETLKHLIPEERRQALLALPKQELWDLEEKFDVDVERVYGAGKITPSGKLAAFMILNWQRDSSEPTTIHQVDLSKRTDLLAAIMKSPGPFYQMKDGSFFQDTSEPIPLPYLETLEDIPIYEVAGGVDFDLAADYCRKILGEDHG